MSSLRQAQGTWCGANVESGRAVFLTNYRTSDLPGPPKRSRGMLVKELLEGGDGGARADYGLCNTVVCSFFDPAEAAVFESNAEGLVRMHLAAPGVHVFSNSERVDDDSWPKVRWLREQAARVIAELSEESDEEVVRERLAALLCSAEDHPFRNVGEEPDTALERQLRRRVFLGLQGLPGYGTRAQTCAMANSDGTATYAVRMVDEATGEPEKHWSTWQLRPQAKLK
jgi:uncharacterized protein with NRDE domain